MPKTMHYKKFNKTFILTFIQVLFFCSTYGQLTQSDTAMLLNSIRQIGTQNQIIYLDSIPANDPFIIRLKKIIKKGKIKEGNTFFRNAKTFKEGKLIDAKKIAPDSIVLTLDEQNYMLSQLQTQTIWPDNLFPESHRISSDSMSIYLKQEDTKRRDKRQKAKLHKEPFILNDLEFVYCFKKPIYIRDNSICLIIISAWCGNEGCGNNRTCFYKKENGKWREWMFIP